MIKIKVICTKFNHNLNFIGTYAFIYPQDTTVPRYAQLVSETFAKTNGKCLSFWYYIYATSARDIEINVFIQHEKNESLSSSVTPTSRQWTKAEIGLYSRTDFRVVIEGYVTSNCNYCFVGLDDIDVKEGNCVGSCSSLPVTARVACGSASVSSQSCVRDYGCCYVKGNSPSCFYHPSSCKSIPVNLRQQCGNLYIRSYSCRRLGCCYDDSTSGLPFKCYYSPVQPTEFPSTLPPVTIPPPSAYDCTFESGLCNFTVSGSGSGRDQWRLMQGRRWAIRSDHTLGDSKGMVLFNSYRDAGK